MARESLGFLKISFGENPDEVQRKRVLPFANSVLYRAEIKNAAELTRGEDVKEKYDIVLDVENIPYDFYPGDTIGILPNNNPEEVLKIFERLNCIDIIYKKCNIILLDAKKLRYVSHLPVKTTLNDVFLKYVDIRSPPKKTFLKILLKYTENNEERGTLEKLSSPTNSEDYITFISTNGRSLLNLLEIFPSCKVPIEILLENLPVLQPRPYSISSSPINRNELRLTFSIEYFDEKTPGVCSGWLKRIITPILSDNEADKPLIDFYFRKPNTFRLNPEISAPIIMIGPGTGVAPFRGFIEHLYLMKKTLDTWLFHGCRYKDRDYLYKDDFEKYHRENYLSKIFVAFSRDQDSKTYVQDIIKRESLQIFKKLVDENATVYVCGDVKDMMKDIRNAIKYCLVENGMTEIQAEVFLTEMGKNNKYIEDKWF